MSSKPSVTHSNKARSENELTSVLNGIQRLSVEKLATLFTKMIESINDMFFELASNADNKSEQSLYFKSMDEVRLNKKYIENTFISFIYEAFSHLGEVYDVEGFIQADQPAPLSLVQDDKLETYVAMKKFVSKANISHASQLVRLSTKLHLLTSSTIITDQKNPLGPDCLCLAFYVACDKLRVGLQSKLIMFKQFDELVLANIGTVYDVILKLTVPDLKASLISSNNTIEKKEQTEATNRHSEQNTKVFSKRQNELNKQGSQKKSSGHKNLPTMPQEELITILSSLQAQEAGDFSEDYELMDTPTLQSVIMCHQTGNNKISHIDEDAMNLVTMLLDVSLSSDQLPDDIKNLLARLQLPLLITGIKDKRLFTEDNHPARRLINDITQASLTRSAKENGRDIFTEKVTGMVKKLVNKVDEDDAIFVDVQSAFSNYLNSDRRKNALINQRLKDADVGKTKVENAKKEVQLVLNSMTKDKDLPFIVLSLLKDAWGYALLVALLRGGRKDKSWIQAINIAEKMINSVCPSSTLNQRSNTISSNTISSNNTSSNNHVATLMKEVRDILTQSSYSLDIEASLEALTEVQINTTKASINTSLDDDLIKVEQKTEQKAHLITQNKHFEDINIFLKRVDTIELGNWIEFIVFKKEKVRCKLDAIIKMTGKYIFVNQFGNKMVEKSRVELAEDMQRGRARLWLKEIIINQASVKYVDTHFNFLTY